MRKKELLEQNISLFEQLQKANFEIASLKKELSERQSEIAALKANTEQEKQAKVSQPIKNLEQKMRTDAAVVGLAPDMEYGAAVIGRIVVSAAEFSGRLTANGDTSHKELVNLILGKTEVAKSEILAIVSSEETIDQKKQLIDAQYDMAVEYFENIMAQLI